LTAWAAKSPAARICWVGGCPIKSNGFSNPSLRIAAYASRLTNKPLVVKGNLVPHDVIRCPRKFVAQRAVSAHTAGPGHLPIKPGLDLKIEASGEFRSFGKGPCQILVAILLVAGSLALPVARPATRYLSTVGRIVACSLEATYGTCFKRDGERQNDAHA